MRETQAMIVTYAKQILSLGIAISIGVTSYFYGLSLEWAITLSSIFLLTCYLLLNWPSSNHIIKPRRRQQQPLPNHLSPIQKAIGFKYGRFGLPRDVRSAFELLLNLAPAKNATSTQAGNESIYELADCYERGIGTKACITMAIHWYKQCYLGGLLTQTDRLNRYNNLIERLVAVMQTKAHDGDIESMYALGFYYRHQHLQTESSINQNHAFYWFSRAAEKKHTQATIELAHCYYNGIGTDKDFSEAEINYRMIVYEFGLIEHTPALIGSLIHEYRREDAQEVINIEKEKDSPSQEILDMEKELIALHFLSNPGKHESVTEVDNQNIQIDQLVTLEHGKRPDYNLYRGEDSTHLSDISLNSTLDKHYSFLDRSLDLFGRDEQESQPNTPNSTRSISFDLSFLSAPTPPDK